MCCCMMLETAIIHKVVQRDEKGYFEFTPEGNKHYYIDCPFCNQKL